MLRGSVEVKSCIFRSLGLLGIILALTLAFSCLTAAQNQAEAVVEQANALLATKQLPNIQQAIELLETALADEPQNGDVLWVLAKAYLYLADRTTDQKLALYEKGKAYADQAVEVAPNNPHCHYWQGALMGRIGQTRGVLNSLFMVKPLQETMELVLELDSNYADAHYVLSNLYDQAPGWPLSIGNKNKALEHIEKALAIDPDNPEYKVQYATVLLSHKRRDEARTVLMEAFESPEMEIDEILRNDAEALLEKLT
jgi:tetratricopeptide (TPR) repeat protein